MVATHPTRAGRDRSGLDGTLECGSSAPGHRRRLWPEHPEQVAVERDGAFVAGSQGAPARVVAVELCLPAIDEGGLRVERPLGQALPELSPEGGEYPFVPPR